MFFLSAWIIAAQVWIVATRPTLLYSEWLVLRRFFKATGGEEGGWYNASGWNVSNFDSAPDPCDGRSWFGIYDWPNYQGLDLYAWACTPPDSNGTRSLQILSLTTGPGGYTYPGNNLVAYPPTTLDLNGLSQLRVLLIMDNPRLSVPIPAVDRLTSLQQLSLGYNSFRGTIPPLDTMTSLVAVELFNNNLWGTVPSLSSLSNLQEFEVGFNQLTGTIPSFAGTKLWYASLSNNQFTGGVPDLNPVRHSIQQLRVQYNRLTGTLPSLSALTNLILLDTFGNSMTGTIPDLSANSFLRVLSIRENNFTGTIPSLDALTALQNLFLYSNALSGTIPRLGHLTQLTELRINDNKLSGTIPELSALSLLTQLDFSNMRLQGTIPRLDKLTGLTVLWLNNNSLVGTIPDLQQLTVLRQLLLHSNALSGSVPLLPDAMFKTYHSTGDDDEYNDSNHEAINTDASLTLFGNRLSCALPNRGARASSGMVAVAAFGNRFSAPAPLWMANSTRDAAFLFVPEAKPWKWVIGYTLGGGACFSIVMLWIKVCRRRQSRRHNEIGHSTLSFLAFQRDTALTLALLASLALVTLLPIYVSGANFFQCGDPLMHTSFVYLDAAPRITMAATVFVCVFSCTSALCCRRLCALYAEPLAKYSPRFRPNHIRSTAYMGLNALAWLFCTALLSTPTVLYIVALYLPADNILGVGANGTLALRRCVPFLLAMINAVFLPALTRSFVRRLGKRNTMDEAAIVSRLLIVARLLTMIVIPVSAVMWLGEGCGDRWKTFWSVCRTNTTVGYNPATGCYPATALGCRYFVPRGGLQAKQLCTTSLSGGASGSRCARGAFEALAPLFAEKFAIAAFLQPTGLLLAYETGLMEWANRIVYRRGTGGIRIGLDLEFAATLAQTEAALFYGLALPIILPLAALSCASHWLAFDFLFKQRQVHALPIASPPIRYLQLSVALQAASATWLFGTTQSLTLGITVGVTVYLGAALAFFGCGRFWSKMGARRRQLSTLKFVTNHRGLRLTNLEEMSTGMHVEEKRSRHESVIESGSETTGGVAPYVEMLD